MAATKRNAGLTSAMPRATLNDEELVSLFNGFFFCFLNIFVFRNNMFIRSHCKLLFIQFHQQLPIILFYGRQPPQHIVMSVRVCCGESQDKVLGKSDFTLFNPSNQSFFIL